MTQEKQILSIQVHFLFKEYLVGWGRPMNAYLLINVLFCLFCEQLNLRSLSWFVLNNYLADVMLFIHKSTDRHAQSRLCQQRAL